MANLSFRVSVLDDVKEFPPQDVKRLLDKIENTLRMDPDFYPELKGIYRGIRKFKVGLYRILFTYQDNNLEILKIGKRD